MLVLMIVQVYRFRRVALNCLKEIYKCEFIFKTQRLLPSRSYSTAQSAMKVLEF
jgi:hypothetical protein